jgi:hypothetical protein
MLVSLSLYSIVKATKGITALTPQAWASPKWRRVERTDAFKQPIEFRYLLILETTCVNNKILLVIINQLVSSPHWWSPSQTRTAIKQHGLIACLV